MHEAILRVNSLYKHFPVFQRRVLFKRQVGAVHACDAVSFDLQRAETLGIIGESGCGKTTLALTITYLLEPDAGEVYFKNEDVFSVFRSKDRKKKLELRKSIQYVFQNPYQSLNPRWTVRDILDEPLSVHNPTLRKPERKVRIREILALVGLEEYHAGRYPNEFSGGQRQRICVARALIVQPELIICDEPVSSLDVSVRAQILNLLSELQEKTGVTYIYISHDLSSVKYISHRVAIMYLGKIVEMAKTAVIFDKPLHPYSKALIDAIPVPDPKLQRERLILPGEPPSPIDPPKGCRFHTRCPYALPKCKEKEPELVVGSDGHMVACHLC